MISMNSNKESFYNLTFDKLSLILNDNNLNDSAASLYFNHYYKKKKIGLCKTDIKKKTQNYIENIYSFDLPIINTIHESEDKTVKFLFELKDGRKVESVLIPFHNKWWKNTKVF